MYQIDFFKKMKTINQPATSNSSHICINRSLNYLCSFDRTPLCSRKEIWSQAKIVVKQSLQIIKLCNISFLYYSVFSDSSTKTTPSRQKRIKTEPEESPKLNNGSGTDSAAIKYAWRVCFLKDLISPY